MPAAYPNSRVSEGNGRAVRSENGIDASNLIDRHTE
jgi:hypothetical protein